MSKRYGRQQKRRAKAKIESLQAKNNELDTIIKIKKREVLIAKHIIEIARKICPNSICFEPQLVGENIWRAQRLNVEINNPVANGGLMPHHPIEISCIDLYQLELSLMEGGFDMAIHYVAKLVDKNGYGRKVAYRISAEGFDSVPVEHVAKYLALNLKLTKQ